MHMESELKLRDCNRSIIKSARITVMLISGHKVVDDTTTAVNELRIERIRDGKSNTSNNERDEDSLRTCTMSSRT